MRTSLGLPVKSALEAQRLEGQERSELLCDHVIHWQAFYGVRRGIPRPIDRPIEEERFHLGTVGGSMYR